MHTLNSNYQKNVDILRENFKRGLTIDSANSAIDKMEAQFERANLYNDEAQLFIAEMRMVVASQMVKATDLMRSMGVTVVEVAR